MADVNRGIQSGELDTEYIRQTSIDRLDAELLIADSVTPGTLPKNSGSTLRWTLNEHIAGAQTYSRFRALTDATVGNSEASYASRAPNEASWAPTTVEKKMDYYGQFVPVRQVDLDWMPRSTMDDLADSVGFAGAETMNGLSSAQVDGRGASGSNWEPIQGDGTTNIYLSGGGGTLPATAKLSGEDLYQVKGLMKADNVRPFKDGYYRAYITPQAAVHLQTDVVSSNVPWQEINKYVSGRNGQTKLTNGEVGAVGGVMVFETTDIYEASQDSTNAYHNMVLGKDGIGGGRMGDMDVQVLINRSDATSIDDPYRMFATVAYRLKAAEKLLREEAAWMLKSSDGTGT